MNKHLRTALCVAMLVAIEVVLSRFCSISTQVVKIGFAFVPVAVCGMLFGPIWTAVCGGLADFLGAILFPIGPYFPGFTLSATLTGLLFGLLLYRRSKGWWHIAVAVAIDKLIISLLLTTYWIHILYGSPFVTLLPTRAVQSAILIVVQFVVILAIQKPIAKLADLMGLYKKE